MVCYADAMNIQHKKTVLILFGGESSEHDVSIRSARNVYNAIDTAIVTPLLCYIDPHGTWWQASAVEKPKQKTERITPLLGTSQVAIGERTVNIDVLFPALHGPNGEDGTIQGLAKLMHTPIVGCGLDGSLLCMDKTLTKQLLHAAGIPVVPGKACAAGAPPAFDALVDELGPLLFLKPARQGSSVGVGKAATEAEYAAAFREAAQYDDVVLIEAAIEHARELEVAVLGDPAQAQASIVGEIIPDREFYTYESKYDANSTSQIAIPAAIDDAVSAQVQETALRAYTALHCRGLARVDFFLASDGALYLNEVNTMPGFTSISMYPKLWEASGLDTTSLVMKLIDQAE